MVRLTLLIILLISINQNNQISIDENANLQPPLMSKEYYTRLSNKRKRRQNTGFSLNFSVFSQHHEKYAADGTQKMLRFTKITEKHQTQYKMSSIHTHKRAEAANTFHDAWWSPSHVQANMIDCGSPTHRSSYCMPNVNNAKQHIRASIHPKLLAKASAVYHTNTHRVFKNYLSQMALQRPIFLTIKLQQLITDRLAPRAPSINKHTN